MLLKDYADYLEMQFKLEKVARWFFYRGLTLGILLPILAYASYNALMYYVGGG